MPHCIIEYTPRVVGTLPKNQLIQIAHHIMLDSGLFGVADVKTRAFVTEDYLLGNGQIGDGDFIHIIIRLLEGRTVEQKRTLTNDMASSLRQCLPALLSITVDIIDMVRATYAKDVAV